MKRTFLSIIALIMLAMMVEAQEYMVITTVESIVPAGIGRSRMVLHEESINPDEFASQRTEDNNKQNKARREDLKIDRFEEIKMLNFYSLTGINFKNVASNDAMISAKLTQMAKEGWKLMFVTSGVESDAGETDGNGIFITRYVFFRE